MLKDLDIVAMTNIKEDDLAVVHLNVVWPIGTMM
jgi:hypothetical protein